MNLIKELLNYPQEIEPKNCYMFTANHTVKSNGELVMGAGNALAFKKAYPKSAIHFGKEVSSNPRTCIHTGLHSDGVIASLQTKQHWKDDSPMWLVQKSIQELDVLARKHPDWTFHLPYPAIGRGGLTKEQVEPMLNVLPDNVLIYIKE